MSDQLESGDDVVNGEEAYALWDDGEKYNPTRREAWILIKSRWNCSITLCYWGK
ncbi:ammonium transporter 1 protein, partial [Trifolium medium]|nr:ammonium transporter 1 protein [Trifolium medium]